MISLLTGTVAYHGVGYILLQAGSVGYKITLPESVAHGLSGEITIYTHEVVRDDGRELFGFTTIRGLELCWDLVAVSGVGAKLAQKIIYGSRSAEEAVDHIAAGDLSYLTSISGVGKKTAQKIILELQGKLVNEPINTFDQDALSALMSLGYSKLHAEEVLAELPADDMDTETRIKAALKLLGKAR